jgi:Ca2+-binding EF-hand superfamily protein
MFHDAKRSVAHLAALALLTILLGASTAHARMRGNFDEADANHDGRVTLQEFEAYVTRRLANVNGPRAQRFRQLSTQEQAARIQQRFNRMDPDHKGYLNRSNWESP